MKDEKILRAYDPVKPDPAAKERMLGNILAAAPAEPARPRFRRFLPAACAAAVLLCALAVPAMLKSTRTPPAAPVVQAAPGEASPMGMRKFMNYNGCRYAFLENGASYILDSASLGESLGTLEFDIARDPKSFGSLDLASTFALGGSVHALPGYDPAFRLAVELNGTFYIAENVDHLDGSDVDVSAYFETADFAHTVESIEICDHMGLNVLTTVTGKDQAKLLDLISRSVPAELTNEDFQTIGRAQSEGRSFRVHFVLADSTRYSLYLIPSLNISMVGDNRYFLPEDFAPAFEDLFAGLTQQPLPMH